jgi:hypothetical protein
MARTYVHTSTYRQRNVIPKIAFSCSGILKVCEVLKVSKSPQYIPICYAYEKAKIQCEGIVGNFLRKIDIELRCLEN